MNTNRISNVELLKEWSGQALPDSIRWLRWKVFFSVFIIASLISVLIVYGRDPLYRATVSVLTVKPRAVDALSEAADTEHVAIQSRLLLGEDLLGRLGSTLSSEGYSDIAGIEALRSILSAVPIPDTNLLELRAEGSNPELLQVAANRWANTYEIFQIEEIEAATGRTTTELLEQQEKLSEKISKAHAELLRFRESNDIVSLERDENRDLSRLKGLNNSLNKARDRLTESKARYQAIQEAVAEGNVVVPRELKSELARKQLEVERLRDRIDDLNSKYTQRYIERDPDLKLLPEKLRVLERDLERAMQLSQRTMLDEAQHEVDAARSSVRALQLELNAHQAEVQVFTDRFKEFKSMEENLARLELLRGDIEERLAKIDVQNRKEFPPIKVVDWATIPTQPIYPNYERDLIIGFGVALLLALFTTWLLEYLTGRSSPQPSSSSMGVRIYANGSGGELELNRTSPALRNDVPEDVKLIQHSDTHESGADTGPVAGTRTQPRELTQSEIEGLLELSDPTIGGYFTLLLSGVSPLELPLVDSSRIDWKEDRIDMIGTSPRVIELSAGVRRRLKDFFSNSAGIAENLSVEELNADLAVAAADAGIENPSTVNAASVWYTYILYLVRQGARLSELSNQVGALSPELQIALSEHSPPGVNQPLSEVNRVHPALNI